MERDSPAVTARGACTMARGFDSSRATENTSGNFHADAKEPQS
jgi:hypothetical protein